MRILILLSCLLNPCVTAFSSNLVPIQRKCSHHRRLASLDDDESPTHSEERRRLLQSIGVSAIVGSFVLQPSDLVSASAVETAEPNLECLLDLPQKAEDSVRLYLCRHGQTENNRLHKVQGARTDVPLNDNGVAMAKRLGKALARLDKECPPDMFHSHLVRARETAQVAATTIQRELPKHEQMKLGTLESLGEVDFGPIVEGSPQPLVRAEMIRTYTAWGVGFVDVKPKGGGESGREVFTRAASALGSLVATAKTSPSGSAVAISHSVFLRIMLAAVLDIPLAKAYDMEVRNGCINVVDLQLTDDSFHAVGPRDALIGGAFSQAPASFSVRIPAGKVIRINEKRHLEGII